MSVNGPESSGGYWPTGREGDDQIEDFEEEVEVDEDEGGNEIDDDVGDEYRTL